MYLKEGNGGRNPSASRLMGQLARSKEPARPPGAVWGSGLEPPGARARGVAGVATCRSASSHPPERGLWAPLTPGVGGRERVQAPAPAPGTSRHWALPRCHLRGRGGARGAGCGPRESAAAASNPPLSSLRLRHARSASRARREAVAACRSQRGRGRAQGQRGARVLGAPQGVGRLGEKESQCPSGLLGAPR